MMQNERSCNLVIFAADKPWNIEYIPTVHGSNQHGRIRWLTALLSWFDWVYYPYQLQTIVVIKKVVNDS